MRLRRTTALWALLAAVLGIGAGEAGSAAAQTSAASPRAATGRSFKGQKLTKAVFVKADLRNADFRGAVLDGADFTEARLQGANFAGASLRKATFLNAQGDGADFSNVMADQVSLVQANLPNAVFTGASLRGAEFGNGVTAGIDFTGANLEGADLNSMWRGVNFSKANLRGALFGFGSATYLEGSNLSGAMLEGVIFEGVLLAGADLRGAKLEGALFGAVGQPSNVRGANLDGAELQGADLGGVDFSGASLVHARVWRTQNTPRLELADTGAIDVRTPPKLDMAALTRANAGNARKDDVALRLRMADPARRAPQDPTPAGVWSAKAPPPKDLAALLADLACAPLSGTDGMPMEQPYIARGLLANGRLFALKGEIRIVADRMRAGKTSARACPGVTGFTDQDWARLDDLAARASASGK